MTSREDLEEQKKQRYIDNLLDDMELFIPYLEDDSVTDISVVDSGELIVTRFKKGREFTGIYVPEYIIERIIKATAFLLDKNLNTKSGFPLLEGIIPKYNARITGLMPPNCQRHEIQIRMPPKFVPDFSDYLEQGSIKKEQYEIVLDSLRKRKNIMVVGSTGSGKTTLTNSLIKEMINLTPDDNFYIVEDTHELKCDSRMSTVLEVDKTFAAKAVEESLRFSPDRIIFGEVRNSTVLVNLLDSWRTGHDGNITTIHARSCKAALSRIKGMLKDEDEDMIRNFSDIVQLLIHIRKSKNGIVIDEIMPITEETDRYLIDLKIKKNK